LYSACRFGFARGRDLANTGEARPVVLLLQPRQVRDQVSRSGLDAARVGVHRLRPIMNRQAGVVQQRASVLVQGPLIAFQRQNVIGLLVA
jgi:hypothetical protein